jgi:type I restriction enzyme S subunit
MIHDLKPYPAYKNSGVPWLGQVPEHWDLAPNRTLIRRRKVLVGSRHSDYILLSLTKQGVIVRDVESGRGKFSADMGTCQEVRVGDLIFCLFDIPETPRTVGLSRYDGMITGAYTVFECLDPVLSAYLDLFYRAMDDGKLLSPLYSGLRKTIPPTRFLGTKTPVPPPPEQAAIVRFLDHADRRTRRYIRTKQKLIKLLEEQKQAIIHRAVTRGLDHNVRLKPSGVEWLGEVPEHWEVSRLKAVLSRPVRNGLFKKKEAFGAGVPLVNVTDVYRDNFRIEPSSLDRVQATPEEVRTYQVQPGDLFFVRSSLKLEGTGRSAIAIDCEPNTVFECHLVQGRPHSERADARFLAVQLNSFGLRHYLISRANVVTMATVPQDVIATCPVWLPSLSEQATVLEHVERDNERLDAAIDRANREIALLREYRTRLIADVVTGKLDVREAAARLPEETDEPEPLDDTEAIAEGAEGTEVADLDATLKEAEI